MKAGAKKAMTKGALTKALATEHGLKQKACSDVLNSIVDIATKEVKKTGVFTLHGLFRIKTRTKPAKGRSEEHIRQRSEGVGKASEDHRQGLPSCSVEEADLEWPFTFLNAISEVVSCGNPAGQT